jgi:sortase A
MKSKSKKTKKEVLAGSRVKLNFKRHFMPPLAGLTVAILIFGFFNSGLLSARIAYYIQSKHPAAQINVVPTSTTIDKNAPPSIIIKKINVNAPVIYDQSTVDQSAFLQALQNGVVHYPNTAFPGQEGNIVIFGHSSEAWWAPGNYKYVFTLLDKLQIQDLIYLNYKGTRYVYRVYDIKVVQPDDLSVLNQSSGHLLTLLTCTPVGTAQKRLVIRSQQILPKVGSDFSSTKAATAPADASGSLPGNASSFWSNFKSLF